MRAPESSNVAMKGYSATCGSIMNVLIPKICRGEVVTMKDIVSTIGSSVEGLAQGQLSEVMDKIANVESQSIETNTMSLFGLAYIAIIVIRHTSKHFKYGRVVKIEYDDRGRAIKYEVQDISDKKVFVFDASSPPSFTNDMFIGREIEFHLDSPTSTVRKGIIKRILRTGYELDINKTIPKNQVKIPSKPREALLEVDDYVSFYMYEGFCKTIIDATVESVGTVIQTGIAIYRQGYQQTALVTIAQFAISTCLILSDWCTSKITTEQMSSNLWIKGKDLILSTISGNLGLFSFYTPIMMMFPALSAFITIPIGIAAYSAGNFLYQKIGSFLTTKQLENKYKELCHALGLEVNCTDTTIATRMRQRYLKCATDQTNCIHQGKILEVDNTTDPRNIKYKIEFKHGLDVWNDIPHEVILNEGRMNSNGDLITCFKVNDIVKVRFERSKQIFQKTTEDFHRLKELRIILKKSSLFYDGQITIFYALSNWITHRYYASSVAPSNVNIDRVEGKDVPSHLEKSDNEILIALEHNIIPKQMNPYAMDDIDD